MFIVMFKQVAIVLLRGIKVQTFVMLLVLLVRVQYLLIMLIGMVIQLIAVVK